MMKRLFSFILCVVTATASFAEQRDTICISGQVLGTDGVPAADVITVKQQISVASITRTIANDRNPRLLICVFVR